MLKMRPRRPARKPKDDLWQHLSTIRVLIADGQRMFAEALAVTLGLQQDLSILEEHPGTEAEAVEAAVGLRPDVVLLDLWIPTMGGVAATRAIATRAQHTKILVMAWEHSAERIRQALDAGAAGYLPKSVSAGDVAEAIRQAQAGEWPVFKDRLENLLKGLEERQMASDEAARRLSKLTAREIQVIGLLAAGLPKEEVGHHLGISKGTVTRHIHKVLVKTGTHTHAEAIAIARSAEIIGPEATGQEQS